MEYCALRSFSFVTFTDHLGLRIQPKKSSFPMYKSVASLLRWFLPELAMLSSLILYRRFLCLSAHLAEITQNQTYTDAAILAATFLGNHLTNDLLVHNSINLSNCDVDNTTFWSSYTGAAIEGLSVLANVTHDDHWYDLYVDWPGLALSAPDNLYCAEQ
jgi:hypothetical protein